MSNIEYTICAHDPGAHLFRITATLADPAADQQCYLPAWIPGSYMIRDFAKHIVSIRATQDGALIPLRKLDKQTWQCDCDAAPLTLTLEVYAWDLSVRTAHLDTTHGFFNGTSVFPAFSGREAEPCEVSIEAPTDAACHHWRLATALTPVTAKPWGFGRFAAADYHELVDHPVEMGSFAAAGFEACGVDHQLVLTGRQDADMARVCADLKTICEHHIRFFGEPAPVACYLFLTMLVEAGYGGLEHRASTALLASRNDLPTVGDSAVSDAYRGFLGLCSHEYFHTWNVKRIQPACFRPPDYRREVHTRTLWAFEGITSYYDDLALCRTGLISVESYLELLGQTITRVYRGSGRHRQSVAESSFDAWTRFYQQDENAPNAIVSYYTKGALVALLLDLTIRERTAGDKSLDDVMRTLWQRYGQAGQGLAEDEIERVTAEVAGSDFSEFFAAVLDSTTELPLAGTLARFGMQLHFRPATSATDRGGKPASEQGPPRLSLGASTKSIDGGEKIGVVLADRPAQRAGLASGDLIVAVNGLRIHDGNLEKRLNRCNAGDVVEILAFRHDELLRFDVELAVTPDDTAYLLLDEDADAACVAQREAWLA